MRARPATSQRCRGAIGGGLRALVIAGALLSTQQAAGAQPAPPAGSARVPATRAGPVVPKTAPVLVDINSADRATLKTLPGVGDAEAARIAAGRPYLTKADLVTRNVLPIAAYLALKKEIIARQDLSSRPGAKAGR
jgi:competence protein ComEA